MWWLGIFLWHILEGPVKLKLSHHESKSSRERWFPCIGRVSLTPLTTVCFLSFLFPPLLPLPSEVRESLSYSTNGSISTRGKLVSALHLLVILEWTRCRRWSSSSPLSLILNCLCKTHLRLNISLLPRDPSFVLMRFPSLSFFPPTTISFFLFYQESHNTL